MKIIKIVLAFAAFLLLSGGQCVFIANSGGSDEDQRSNLVVIIRDGRLVCLASITLSGFATIMMAG